MEGGQPQTSTAGLRASWVLRGNPASSHSARQGVPPAACCPPPHSEILSWSPPVQPWLGPALWGSWVRGWALWQAWLGQREAQEQLTPWGFLREGDFNPGSRAVPRTGTLQAGESGPGPGTFQGVGSRESCATVSVQDSRARGEEFPGKI